MLEVEGSLRTAQLLEINGSAEIDHDLEGYDVRVGGRLEAGRVTVSNELDVAGVIETDRGMKAKSVTVRSGSHVEGAIIAEHVDIGKSYAVIMDWEKGWMGQLIAMRLVGRMTRVEDIYADLVHLGKVSKSGRIYARVVELENGSIADEIVYTEELRGNVNASHIERSPKKVDRLPEPPF